MPTRIKADGDNILLRGIVPKEGKKAGASVGRKAPFGRQ